MLNHLFAPSLIDQAFAVWHKRGLVYSQDLFSEDGFASFEFLCEDHNLPESHYFRYLLVRSFASKYFPGYPSPLPKDLLHSVLNVNPLNKGAISKICAFILNSCRHAWDKIKTGWEGEVREVIPEDSRKNTIQCTHTSSLCIRHGLIQFKAVHRLHHSNDRLVLY